LNDKKVLLIEDDFDLQKLINKYLESYDYECNAYSKPLEALKEFEENHIIYSIVILDLGLPQIDGFDLLKKLRQIKNIPIIISTARDDIGNKIYGFELGVEDYLSKPYEPRELILRMDAILKRGKNDEEIQINDLLIDLNKNIVFLEQNEIDFTKIELEIFFTFIKNMNKVISREDIINQTSLNEGTKNRTIDMHISNIRFKIHDDTKEQKYIKSVWGIGYKFINDN